MAGEGEQAPDEVVRVHSPKRDSTVVTIARVSAPAELLGEPRVEVVQHYWWTGRDHSTQYTALLELVRARWHCRSVWVDATGVGAGIASFLARALGEHVVEAVGFTRPRKSELGYGLLSAVRAGRVRMYADDGSKEAREFWYEASVCRYAIVGASQQMSLNFYVDDKDGHDDFVVSLALAVAAAGLVAPAPAGVVIEAPPMYVGEGRF